MSTVILRGEDALNYALNHNLTVNKYEGDDGPAREGLTTDEARSILTKDPGLIWIEVDSTVHNSDETEAKKAGQDSTLTEEY